MKFYNPTTRSFFKTRTKRFIEEFKFRGERNTRNIVFKGKFVIDNEQVFAPIIVEETNMVINNDVIPDIVQRQDNIHFPFPTPHIVQNKQPQEQHKDDIDLIKEDLINF
ncbi:hypothetical protein CR513_24261, partial [Mucuna pruriens]